MLDSRPCCAHDPAMPSERLAKVLKPQEELLDDESVELARELLRTMPDDIDELDDLDRDELRRPHRRGAERDGDANSLGRSARDSSPRRMRVVYTAEVVREAARRPPVVQPPPARRRRTLARPGRREDRRDRPRTRVVST